MPTSEMNRVDSPEIRTRELEESANLYGGDELQKAADEVGLIALKSE